MFIRYFSRSLSAAALAILLPLDGAATAAEKIPALGFEADGGWHEAVVSVTDIERQREFFETAAGWQVIDAGPMSREELDYLELSESVSTADYMVLRPLDYGQGWVRLVRYGDGDGPIIRANAQAWDTGGIFSLMTRSADATRNLRTAERLGWLAYNEPYQFEFGELSLLNIVLRGPDGLNVAVYEWLAPKLADPPAQGALSKAFNSMQMVSDINAARTFYVDGLGFEVIAEGEFIDPVNRPTNFALPVNYATRIPRAYAILIPAGGDRTAGRVELMAFPGFEGRDLAARATAGARGIQSLRFPVSDVEAVARRVTDAGAPILFGPAPLPMPPFGNARALTTKSPDGAWLTFFEPPQ
jgi:catechol 2,3-dioxygenase-like lactoylglutathione lyase family enzyme